MAIEHSIYPYNDRDIAIEHYKINDGEHLWFDNSFEGLNTWGLVWDFVSKYDIHGLKNNSFPFVLPIIQSTI